MDRSNLSNWWWSNIRKVVRYFRKKYLLLWYLHEYKKVVLYVLWKILPICFHFKNWIPSWFSLGLDLTKPIICLYYTFNKWILLHNSSTIFSLTAKKSCESLQRTPCTSLYNSIHQRRSFEKKYDSPKGLFWTASGFARCRKRCEFYPRERFTPFLGALCPRVLCIATKELIIIRPQ